MKRNYDNWLDAFMEWTSDVNAPEDYLRFSALWAVSSTLERRCWLKFRGKIPCYPNLFVIIVGPAGIRKSSSTSFAVKLVEQVPDLGKIPESITTAAIIDTLLDRCNQRLVDVKGTPYPNSSSWWYLSELITGINQGEHTAGNLQLITDLYECKPYGWHQVGGPAFEKRTVGRGMVSIYNPCINFLACSTPKWLVEAVGRTNIEGGFSSRVIYVHADKLPRQETAWEDLEEVESIKSDAMERQLIEDLCAIREMTGEYKPTKGYKQYFTAMDERVKTQLREDDKGTHVAYYMRKPWNVMKVSMALAACESNTLVLQERHIEQAEFYIDQVEPSIEKSFLNMTKTNRTQLVSSFWEKMRKTQYFTKEVAVKRLVLTHRKDEIMDIIGTLITANKIKIVQTSDGMKYKVLDSTPLD